MVVPTATVIPGSDPPGISGLTTIRPESYRQHPHRPVSRLRRRMLPLPARRGAPPSTLDWAHSRHSRAQAGFRQIRVTDTTENTARIAKQWHHAREKRKEEPAAAEGNINFEGLQQFLSCTHTLAGKTRLLRNLDSASKELRDDLIQRIWELMVSEVLLDALR